MNAGLRIKFTTEIEPSPLGILSEKILIRVKMLDAKSIELTVVRLGQDGRKSVHTLGRVEP